MVHFKILCAKSDFYSDSAKENWIEKKNQWIPYFELKIDTFI